MGSWRALGLSACSAVEESDREAVPELDALTVWKLKGYLFYGVNEEMNAKIGILTLLFAVVRICSVTVMRADMTALDAAGSGATIVASAPVIELVGNLKMMGKRGS